MSIIAVIGSSASGGRFVPPITVARSGLGLSAGQFRITDYTTSYNYTLGGSASRSGNTLSLPNAPSGPASQGTVQPFPPKGVTGGTVVNVARTPYTYYTYHTNNPYCASHWSSGQCAAWGNHVNHYGPYKNATPTNYTDSEGEWWRIW